MLVRDVLVSSSFVVCSCLSACASTGVNSDIEYEIDYDTRVDALLQAELERLDGRLRLRYQMSPEQTAVGVLDLRTGRLAMIHPDRGEYAASIPKIGILLAYFELHPEAATALDPAVREELGRMAKASDNEIAAKYSQAMGLREIQTVLNRYGLYDAGHGGGIWVGKHYGKSGERIGDPVGDNSHAATVRQLLRYFLWLEQGRLVSPEASRTMREIFLSPEIPHDQNKFVLGLAGRDRQILRKWGSWEDSLHDSAVVSGRTATTSSWRSPITRRVGAYLVDLASEIDDLVSAS